MANKDSKLELIQQRTSSCLLCCQAFPKSSSSSLINDFEVIFKTLIGEEFKGVNVEKTCESCLLRLRSFYEFREKVLQNLRNQSNFQPVEEEREEEGIEYKEDIKEEFQEDFEPGCLEDEDDLPLVNLKKEPKPKIKSKTRKRKKVEVESDDEEQNAKIREFFDLSCKLCGAQFNNFSDWKNHMKQAHDQNRPYIECCGIQLHARSNLLTHHTLHVNPDAFKCHLCGRQCKSEHRLKEHLLSRHNQGEKKFKCEVCLKLFPALTSLKKHKFVHLSEEERQFLKAKNTCNECGLGFLTSSILTYHIRQRHEGKYACVCDICAKSFKTKQNFLTHYQHHHIASGSSKKQCNICGQWLSDGGSLRRHVKNMHQNKGPHICSICSKQTPTMNALKAHLNYVHNDERKYACSICDKKFKRPIGLKEHMTIHIGGALYSCSFCTKTFNSSANLYSHRKKVHQEEYEATKIVKKEKS